MKLYTKLQLKQLLANGRNAAEERDGTRKYDGSRKPVVKWFAPFGGATWLISEIDPDSTDIAFGLADLGLGFPELGDVYIPEIKAIRGPLGLGVERDLHWDAEMTLADYADLARKTGSITA